MIPKVRSIHRATKKENQTIPHVSPTENYNSFLKMIPTLLSLLCNKRRQVGNQYVHHRIRIRKEEY